VERLNEILSSGSFQPLIELVRAQEKRQSKSTLGIAAACERASHAVAS
jgi:hypothetical protein